MFAVTYIADNIAFVFTTFVMLSLPGIAFIRERYRCLYPLDQAEIAERESEGENGFTVFNLIMCFAVAFVILFVSVLFTDFVNGTSAPFIVKQLFGQKYLILTLITVGLATAFPQWMGKLSGGYEVGMLLLNFFFIASTIEADMKGDVRTGSVALHLLCNHIFRTACAASWRRKTLQVQYRRDRYMFQRISWWAKHGGSGGWCKGLERTDHTGDTHRRTGIYHRELSWNICWRFCITHNRSIEIVR